MSADFEVRGVITADDKASATMQKVGASAKQLVVGFSGVATSCFSLYNAYDRVSDMQLQVDRANFKVKSSANQVEDAQRRQTNTGKDLEDAQDKLAQTIEEYGEDSAEAAKQTDIVNEKLSAYQAASEDAKISTERYDLAVDNAKQTQDNFNEAIVQSALQIVPTAITLITNIGNVANAWKGVEAAAIAAKTAQVGAGIAGGASGVGGVLGGAGLTAASVLGGASMAIPIAGPIISGFVSGQLSPEEEIERWTKPAQGMEWWHWIPFAKKISDWINGAPAMAEGGIVTQPTLAVVGESGPEAIVPLNSASSFGDVKIQATIENRISIGNLSSNANLQDILRGVTKAVTNGTDEGMSNAISRYFSESYRRRNG